VRENELITLGEVDDFILKKGSWYSYITPSDDDINLGQGKNSAVAFLKNNPTMKFELENRIREKHEIPLLTPEEAGIPAEEMMKDAGKPKSEKEKEKE
jgi:recombination protein RecA